MAILAICQRVVPVKYPYPTAEGHWKFQEGGKPERPKFSKESISLTWNFQKGGGSNQKILHRGSMDTL